MRVSSAYSPFRAAVCAIAVLTVMHALYYFPRTVDDMYIFLRYAENLARGLGPVFNPGERVEGFSSPLWVALLGLGEWLGVGGVSYEKWLASVSLAALMLGLYRLGREYFALPPSMALIAPAFTALNSYVISWAVLGLETPAYLALMVWSVVTLDRLLRTPSRAHRSAFIGVASALSLVRPEAPLFVALVTTALVFQPTGGSQIRQRMRMMVVPSAAVLGVFAGYVLFRRFYFGLWLPHTYYAKLSSGFLPGHWQGLWHRGASVSEVGMVMLGTALALWVGISRRLWVPLAILIGVLVFAASVLSDWMPNQRHFLPIWVFFPPLMAYALEQLRRWLKRDRQGSRPRRIGLLSFGALALLTTSAACQIASVDSRFSPADFATHGRGEHWVVRKSMAMWRDTWSCLRHRRPPAIDAMPTFENGMITQIYRLFEYESRPLSTVWFIGRDIGRVGYLADVRVFDTDGLFTPAVVQSDAWRMQRAVDASLIDEAFRRDVGMTELVGAWAIAARTAPAAHGCCEPIRRGDASHWRARDRPRPSSDQVRARYRRALDRMPSSYYVMTLYGEAVGAALERRMQLVEQELSDNRLPQVDTVSTQLSGRGAVFDGLVELEGCEVAPSRVYAGDEVTLTCYLRAKRAIARDYMIFVHLEQTNGRQRMHADHRPMAGWMPTSEWPVGRTLRDVKRFTVPVDTVAGEMSGEWRVHVGLFIGNHRATVRPEALSDGSDRVNGPVLHVMPPPPP